VTLHYAHRCLKLAEYHTEQVWLFTYLTYLKNVTLQYTHRRLLLAEYHTENLAFQISHIKKKKNSGLELATNRIFRTGCVLNPPTPPPPPIATIIIYT
jgi:hypothetical protein